MFNIKQKEFDMEIQAGKRYIRRNGEVSEVIVKTGWPIFPFKEAGNGRTYTSKGGLVMTGSETPYDLVSEYVVTF
jgi:hypothetical protein